MSRLERLVAEDRVWIENEEYLVSENDPFQGQIKTSCKTV